MPDFRRAAPLLAAAVPAAAALHARFHLHLVRSLPAAESSVARPPAALELWFSQPAEAAVTRVRLVGPGGPLALGTLAVSGTKVAAPVRAAMPAGSYRVEWRTMAADGHAVTGHYAFRVTGAAR